MTYLQEMKYPSMWVLWFGPAFAAAIFAFIYPSRLLFWLTWIVGMIISQVILFRWRTRMYRDHTT